VNPNVKREDKFLAPSFTGGFFLLLVKVCLSGFA